MTTTRKEKSEPLSVCFFGIYDPNYARSKVLMNGFRENGYEVAECHVDPKKFRGFRKYTELYRVARELRKRKFDFVIVGFPGQAVLALAWMLFGKGVILDAFLSLYDSNVNDRKLYGAFTLRAFRDWVYDWYSCRLSARVLLDTNAHIKYFERTFGIPEKKFVRVFISADEEVFTPLPETRSQGGPFIVEFHGTFIPVQGIKYILDAAELLKGENIEFRMIGKGQDYAFMTKYAEDRQLSRVLFLGPKSLEGVREEVRNADVCLGIFGESEKATRAIPNKVYECIAMKKAVISVDSSAARELFTPDEEIVMCAQASGSAIADAIMRVKNDPTLKSHIVEKGYQCYKEKLRPKILIARLIEDLKK